VHVDAEVLLGFAWRALVGNRIWVSCNGGG
jgi:hypothetical protein